MQVSIYRYNPDVDSDPYMQDFSIEIPGGRDLMVLDVLELLKEKDPSVTYRRSCREGVCGSRGLDPCALVLGRASREVRSGAHGCR